MPDLVPVHLWNPSSIKRSVTGQLITSGASISGAVQALRTDGGGLRRIDFNGIRLHGARAIQDWYAWQSYLKGGAQIVDVPMAAVALAPMAVRGMRGLAKPIPIHPPSADADSAFPSRGPFMPGNAIVVNIAPAPLRATTVTLTVEKGSPIRGGMPFSINHSTYGNRTYITERVLSRNANSATVTIDIPLREAVTVNQSVDFEWPRFVGRMIPDQDISPEISVRYGAVSISFIEAFQ